MNPITREESLLDGQDLTPITRKEKFIKRIYDKTQEVPTPVTREEWFLNKAAEGSGGDVTIEQLSVTENGTYSEAGKAYSPVIVEVPAPTLKTKTITENGTYNASEDNADGYSQVTVNVPYMEKKSASGDIASFSDGAGYPFLKVKANINPVQDLHGYDYPWVGGAGKNKINAPDITLADAGDIYNGAVNLSAGTYTLSSSNTTTSVTVEGVSGTMPLTFTLANAITTIQITASGAGEFKNIQIESGSSATSFAPYSNICPISGFTGVNVAVTGVNIWDEEWEVGIISDTTGVDLPDPNVIRSKNYIRVFSGKNYYFKSPTNGIYQIFLYDSKKSFMYAVLMSNIINNVYTIPSGCAYIRFRCLMAYGTTYNNDIGVNYPSTDTSYHAYNGHVYPISWQDEAGIVYGGYIDLVSGVLVVDRAYVDLSALSWNYGLFGIGSSWKTPILANMKSYADGVMPNILCEKYKPNTINHIYQDNVGIGIRQNGSTLYVNNQDSVNSPTGQLVYELTTPQTYQLTPQQISTLIEQNNAWNNTNGQTEVEYFIPIE